MSVPDELIGLLQVRETLLVLAVVEVDDTQVGLNQRLLLRVYNEYQINTLHSLIGVQSTLVGMYSFKYILHLKLVVCLHEQLVVPNQVDVESVVFIHV